MNRTILDKAQAFSEKHLSDIKVAHALYHDVHHTRTVVASAERMARMSNVNPKDELLLLVAAWFHDLGYTEKTEGHEEISSAMVKSFLENEGVLTSDIEKVQDIVLATRLQAEPRNLLERIIKDADMTHIAIDEYEERSELLRKEKEILSGETFSDLEWLKINIAFFENQEFYSEAGKKLFEKKKESNLKEMLQKLDELETATKKN